MKVCYTLPIRGMMRLSEDGIVDLPGMRFRFLTDAVSGYVNALDFEILDVPRDEWPTLVPVDQDPNATIKRFPFDTNPKAVRFSSYLPQILNLESLLSLFDLESIDFAMVREQWTPDQGDESVGILGSIGRKPTEREPDAAPVSNLALARIIAASNGAETETGALAHFRVAAEFFHEERYIDAIRYAYLTIEYLYARGNHKKTQTLEAFNASPELGGAVNKALGLPLLQQTLRRLQGRYPALTPSLDASVLLEWAYDLRGNIQHGNPASPRRWHPSRQDAFKDECLVLLNVAHGVCWTLADQRLRQVKVTDV